VSRLLKRWWWVLLLISALAGAGRLRFNVDILDLLPPDQPAVKGLKLYQKHFTNARELIITLRAPDADRAERLAGALADRLQQQTNLVVGASWQPPWVKQPGQLAEILACLWLNQPPEVFGDLTNRLAPEHLPAVLAETRETLATSLSPVEIARRAFDPFDLLNLPALQQMTGSSFEQGQKMFASSEGNFRLVFVQARPKLAGYRECASWLASIQVVVDNLRRDQPDWDGVEVHYTGRPVFVAEIASGMQRDLSGSVAGTAVIIAILFWLTHRRWLPMFWLLTLLLLILAGTLALGGLVLGTISVVSMGFAAVLLGLAVDYAVVHYQEALAHPQLSIPEIRRAIAPSILWAAITTISAFMVLNLGGLPGLAQLGTLVAIGVALAALVMVMVYLPPLFPDRRQPGRLPATRGWWSYFVSPPEPLPSALAAVDGPYCRKILRLTLALILVAAGLLCFRRPGLDKTADALRPQNTQAEKALMEITAEMGIPQDALWLIVSGKTEGEVYPRLALAEESLKAARAQQIISGYLLPTALWPRPEFQAANRATAEWLGRQGSRLRAAALAGGFNTNALSLTDELVQTWAKAGAATGTIWPANEVSQWLLKRFTARADDAWFAMGLVYPGTNQTDTTAIANLSSGLARHQVFLSGWSLLGATTLKRVQERLWYIVAPMVILVLLALWLAFRRMTEILLGLAVLLLSGLCLLATMALAGWSWNLLNLMALPLMLGTGVDYCLFMQLALRRHGGDLAVVRRSIGRALLLCGGTAIAGFGSLAWSGNTGMASLGKVCALAICANMLIAVYLLPAWWVKASRKSTVRSPQSGLRTGDSELKTVDSALSAPSAFYRAWLWRPALLLVRILPALALKPICLALAELYYRIHRQRRAVVVSNLLPAVQNDRCAAEKVAHALFRQFALKLIDLWRFESGIAAKTWLTAGTDWDTLEAACRRGQGVLLLTPHLGNWELGGALLAQRGIKLVVLTQAEPGSGDLTELRINMRARWGIETFVIGGGGFDFVEVIRRLQSGANVALLIDRPPEQKAVTVELFGRPFRASIAAAELARASGCALIGVVVVREPDGYAARILPEFKYERAALGNREARRQLTRQIILGFEPEIRRHADQWFHFVPVWPEEPETAHASNGPG
jgi:predicted RND superfamily exporter protein/lauroyl/myristoyl acyltransferase